MDGSCLPVKDQYFTFFCKQDGCFFIISSLPFCSVLSSLLLFSTLTFSLPFSCLILFLSLLFYYRLFSCLTNSSILVVSFLHLSSLHQLCFAFCIEVHILQWRYTMYSVCTTSWLSPLLLSSVNTLEICLFLFFLCLQIAGLQEVQYFVKGSLESVLARCQHYQVFKPTNRNEPMLASDRQRFVSTEEQLASRGLRGMEKWCMLCTTLHYASLWSLSRFGGAVFAVFALTLSFAWQSCHFHRNFESIISKYSTCTALS